MEWVENETGTWETTTPAGIPLLMKPTTNGKWSLYIVSVHIGQYSIGIYDTVDECKKWIHDALKELQNGRTGYVE